MFWQQLNIEDSVLNELVDKEDTTLDRVLAEDDVIQECKTKNEKLLEFLSRTENMMQLINHIIYEPVNEPNEKIKFYKAYVSSELLSSDASNITDKLSKDDLLLDQLWDFVRTDNELNPLLASFFSKVIQVLLNRCPNSVLEYLKDNSYLIDKLIFHLDISAIMDLLYKLITCFENSITRFKCCHWLRDVRLIQKLIAQLRDDVSKEKITNTCQLLCDTIRACRDPAENFKGAKDALLIELEQEQTIETIVTSITRSKNKCLIDSGIGVLITYLKKPSPLSMVPLIIVAEAEKPTLIILESFNNVMLRQLEGIQNLINIGGKETVSSDKLQVIRLLGLLVQCNIESINKEMMRLKTFDLLWNLFLDHKFNNFLHTQVTNVIEYVLSNKNDDSDIGNLVSYLISEMNFLYKIIDVWDEPTVKNDEDNSGKVKRCGYMGHVYKLAKIVDEVIKSGENKEILVQWISAQENVNFWSEFYDEKLKPEHERSEMQIGNDPRRLNTLSSEDDEEKFNLMGFKDVFQNNPLFSWKREIDNDDDLEFSYEPQLTNKPSVAQAPALQPIVVPTWKEKTMPFDSAFTDSNDLENESNSSSEDDTLDEKS